MCLGGGGGKQYDAYANGDYQNWKSLFDQQAAVETALAKGEIDQATADARMAALQDPDAFASNHNIRTDASANMDMREYERQHDIDLGRIGIDKSFAKFDDPYYDQYKADYTGYYYPQLDRQYGKAVDKMTAALAGRGMLESTAGASQFADLGRENAEARTNIANEAQDAANKLRGTVENEKSNLYSLNQASADPQAVNAQAVGQATALVAPPQYSPLGQVFANALGSLGNFVSAKQNTPTKSYVSPYPTGYGSGKVVG